MIHHINLTMKIVLVKVKRVLGIIPSKSAIQYINTPIIMKRITIYGTITFLFIVVLFTLSTGSGANL